MSCVDFRGWIDGAQRQSMTSLGEESAEEEREKFLSTQPESNRQPLAYETRMVPQDHCQFLYNAHHMLKSSEKGENFSNFLLSFMFDNLSTLKR
jgi:hypothetical protein